MEAYSSNLELLGMFLTLLARTGGYAGVIIILLSITILVLAIRKRAKTIAYSFAVITLVMCIYVIVGPRSPSMQLTNVILHSGRIVMTFPYILILWMLLKAKGSGKGPSQQRGGE